MLEFLRRPALSFGLAVAMAPLLADASFAEIRKMMSMCPGQKLCAWYQSTVTPPNGWVEDKKAGEQNFLTMLKPDKPNSGAKHPGTRTSRRSTRVGTCSREDVVLFCHGPAGSAASGCWSISTTRGRSCSHIGGRVRPVSRQTAGHRVVDPPSSCVREG
jgi:hypothetical protein